MSSFKFTVRLSGLNDTSHRIRKWNRIFFIFKNSIRLDSRYRWTTRFDSREQSVVRKSAVNSFAPDDHIWKLLGQPNWKTTRVTFSKLIHVSYISSTRNRKWGLLKDLTLFEFAVRSCVWMLETCGPLIFYPIDRSPFLMA